MPKASSLVRMEVLACLAAFAFLTYLLASTDSSHFQSPLSAFPQTSPILAKDYESATVDSGGINAGIDEIGPVGPGKGHQWRRRQSALRWKVTKGTAPRLIARKAGSMARPRLAKREPLLLVPGVQVISEIKMQEVIRKAVIGETEQGAAPVSS